MFKKTKKRSFFEKLTGSVNVDDDFDYTEEEEEQVRSLSVEEEPEHHEENTHDLFEDNEEGQLSVDVLQSEGNIIIKAMVAGVRPSDLDIDITRDMVTIHGTREETIEESAENYFHRELYWGSFSRNILLPEEVDVEEAEAIEKNGLLIITLPKLDRNKKTKLNVKAK
jgi:HSP20 family protein